MKPRKNTSCMPKVQIPHTGHSAKKNSQTVVKPTTAITGICFALVVSQGSSMPLTHVCHSARYASMDILNMRHASARDRYVLFTSGDSQMTRKKFVYHIMRQHADTQKA